MTELEFLEGRILHHEKRLKKAEADYHHAVTYGELHDMHAKLVECQAIRAKLIMYLRRRDELTGGGAVCGKSPLKQRQRSFRSIWRTRI